MSSQVTRLHMQEPAPSQHNWPSYLYLGLFVANSVAILTISNLWLQIPLILVQGFFFMGLLELMHQSVHRNFVTNRTSNEIIGTLAAALIGLNLVSYRYFHLEHHRHTCDDADPEGLLYAHSPSTRWSALIAPLGHVWVAFSINQLADRYVPAARRSEWQRCNLVLLLMLVALALLVVTAPAIFVALYLLPLCLFAWIDFFFSQAEHYGAPIRSDNERVDVGLLSYDVRVPLLLSHLMLNRNLHRVHHVWPRTRWFEAPHRAPLLNGCQPKRSVSVSGFLQRWLREGPRLWQ